MHRVAIKVTALMSRHRSSFTEPENHGFCTVLHLNSRRLPGGVSAVYRHCMTRHEAGLRTAKPEDCIGYLRGGTEPPGRNVTYHFLRNTCFVFLRDHRSVDDARTDRVDTNAALTRIPERRSSSSRSHHAWWRDMRRAAGDADEPAEGRVVHDCAGTLLSHLQELILHAKQDTIEIHAEDTSVLCSVKVRLQGFDTSIVECYVKTSEFGDGYLNSRFNIRFVTHVATNGDCLCPDRT